jgi:hypothetical protein
VDTVLATAVTEVTGVLQELLVLLVTVVQAVGMVATGIDINTFEYRRREGQLAKSS